MRVLHQDDLRWVAGGLCKHGLYTPGEAYDQADNERAAQEAMNYATIELMSLDPSDPGYTAATQALDNAVQWYQSVTNTTMSYMDVCTEALCDSSGGWGGQPYTPPPPTYSPRAEDGGASYAPPSEGNWLGNALSAVSDFLGFDGNFGYDGPAGREWAWQSAVDRLQEGFNSMSTALQQAFGSLANYAVSYWTHIVGFLQDKWNDALAFFGVDGEDFVVTSDASGTPPSVVPPPKDDPNVVQVPVTQYFDGTTPERTNSFATPEAAATAALKAIGADSISQNREFNGYIVAYVDDTMNNGLGGFKYRIEEISKGGADYSYAGGKDGQMMGGLVVATFHTHGGQAGPEDNHFSVNDYNNSNGYSSTYSRSVQIDEGGQVVETIKFKSFFMDSTGRMYVYSPTETPYSPSVDPTEDELKSSAHQVYVTDLIP